MTETLNMKHGDNPADHTVDDVKAYWELADADERARILQAEADGKGRATIANLANTPAANPDEAARRQSGANGAGTADTAAMDQDNQPTLSAKKVLQAVNAEDPDDADPDTVQVLNDVLLRFGAQDPSRELPRSWQRVQRRIKLEDNETPDGIATPEQIKKFAAKAGVELTR